ncbi:MAG: RluA family pseudouridine synthase [Thermodesulfobacteriota bacterium]
MNGASEDWKRLLVAPSAAGQRLDQYLARHADGLSRSAIQNLLRQGRILVDARRQKPGMKLQGGETIAIHPPEVVPAVLAPEPVPFDLLHEDAHIAVLAKPPGLVVHPAAGHRCGTLVHGLLHSLSDLSGINGEERPGIVHRLDRDTSGVMVVAKSDSAHAALVEQFKNRRIRKVYVALVAGCMTGTGRIVAAIGRHPVDRKKMAVRREGGREAVSEWQVLENFSQAATLVEVRPLTGRTHQIRVHLSSIGHPIAGDPVYGGFRGTAVAAPRLCLHALRLGFFHPATGCWCEFEAPLWPDIAELLAAMRAGTAADRRQS